MGNKGGEEEDSFRLSAKVRRGAKGGKSDGEKRGEVNGERLLCRCLSSGWLTNKSSSSRSGCSRKWDESSSLSVASDGAPAGDCRSTCLVDGGIVIEPLAVGSKSVTLEER
jgi:hypothetical protein